MQMNSGKDKFKAELSLLDYRDQALTFFNIELKTSLLFTDQLSS